MILSSLSFLNQRITTVQSPKKLRLFVFMTLLAHVGLFGPSERKTMNDAQRSDSRWGAILHEMRKMRSCGSTKRDERALKLAAQDRWLAASQGDFAPHSRNQGTL
jgi:hypothetical protein